MFFLFIVLKLRFMHLTDLIIKSLTILLEKDKIKENAFKEEKQINKQVIITCFPMDTK